MDTLSVRCPRCGSEFHVPVDMAGRGARCACGRLVQVPQADASACAQGRTSAAEQEETVEEMWYFVRDGERTGPLSLEEMTRAAEEGGVRPGDRVWSNRINEWRDASDVPELAGAIGQARAGVTGDLWYYRRRGEVGGPVGFRQVHRMVEQKRLEAGDTVFCKRLGDWRDVRDVASLESAFAAAEAGLGEADRRPEQWYFRRGGEERGPVSERYVAEMVARGDLDPQDPVWGPGFDGWQPLQGVPELARYVNAARRGKPQGAAAEPRPTYLGTLLSRAGGRAWIALGLAAALILVLAAVLYLAARR